MALAGVPQLKPAKRRIRKVSAFLRTWKGVTLNYVSPESLLGLTLLSAIALSFFDVNSWFFIFAAMFPLGYFIERAVLAYGRAQRRSRNHEE